MSQLLPSILLPTVRELVPGTHWHVCQSWIGIDHKFEVVRESLQVTGYQLYAVEKWVVDRTRPVKTLVVFTGVPEHEITVTALRPSEGADAGAAYDAAIHALRRDGARPKEISHGTLLVTSLARFRSDHTIVPIPSGKYMQARDQLYVNINLLRMGCTGRSALTLEDSSDSTKDRFLSMYHIPDIHASSNSPPASQPPASAASPPTSPDPSIARTSRRDPATFNMVVLELVTLIQAALFVCGMLNLKYMDGLLCDETVEALQKWVSEIGVYAQVEPMERVADPSAVAALLSLVLSVRNQLSFLGYSHIVPKDPLLNPTALLAAVRTFEPTRDYLSRSVIRRLADAYEKKQGRSTDKMRGLIDLSMGNTRRRGIWAPTQDLAFLAANAERGAVRALWSGRIDFLARMKAREKNNAAGLGSALSDGEADEAIPGSGLGSDADADGGITQWSDKVQKKIESWAGLSRAKKHVSVDLSNLNLKGAHKLHLAPWNRAEEDEEDPLSSGRTSPISEVKTPNALISLSPDSFFNRATAPLSRSRSASHARTPTTGSYAAGSSSAPFSSEPSSIIISDKGSPDQHAPEAQQPPAQGSRSRLWPPGRGPQSRVSSWSDPVSARDYAAQSGSSSDGELEEMYHRRKKRIPKHHRPLDSRLSVMNETEEDTDLGRTEIGLESGTAGTMSDASTNNGNDYVRDFARRKFRDKIDKRAIADGGDAGSNAKPAEEKEDGDGDVPSKRRRRLLSAGVRRRRSYHDMDSLRSIRALDIKHMRVDVEICGQLLIMRRRERYLADMVACLRTLVEGLSETNGALLGDLQHHKETISALETRSAGIAATEAMRYKADVAARETRALVYETDQLRVGALWATARQPREKVLAIRDKVFGDHAEGSSKGRKLPPGVKGAHGKFNRLQWTLRGDQRLVDALGRTESEVEEEETVAAFKRRLPLRGQSESGDLSVYSLGDEDDLNQDPEEDQAIAVENPRFKPTWLLTFFTRWTARARGNGGAPQDKKPTEQPSSSTEPAHDSNAVLSQESQPWLPQSISTDSHVKDYAAPGTPS